MTIVSGNRRVAVPPARTMPFIAQSSASPSGPQCGASDGAAVTHGCSPAGNVAPWVGQGTACWSTGGRPPW